MAEVIYEMRYPKEEVEHPDEPIKTTPATAEQKEGFERFMQDLETSTVLVLLPPRQLGAEKFIKTAIGVSELYHLDLRLTRHNSHICATLSFDDGGGMTALKPLLAMGDDYAFFTNIYGKHNTISIDYYTHAVYRHDRLLAPVEWDFTE